MAQLCSSGIVPTDLVLKATKGFRYAFRECRVVVLTESARALHNFPMGRLRNPRRERFAVEVASMVPVDRAYLAAGFRSKPEWARPNGSKLAHQPEVAARIAELHKEFTASCSLSVEYLQAKLLPAAEANVVDFFTADGKLKAMDSMTRDQGAAISSIKFHDNGEVAELKLIPKDSAVGTLLRSIGAIVDRHQHAHLHGFAPEGLADRLNAARERFATQLACMPSDDQIALAEALEQEAGQVGGKEQTAPAD